MYTNANKVVVYHSYPEFVSAWPHFVTYQIMEKSYACGKLTYSLWSKGSFFRDSTMYGITHIN